MLARDRGAPPIVFQLLVYPALEHEFERPSMIENAEGYMLTTEAMRWFYRPHLNDPSEGDDPRVSPIRAESLAGLPPAFVDHRRVRSAARPGRRLRRGARGRGSRGHRARPTTGVFHGFFNMQAMLDQAKVAVADAAVAFRDAFGT